MVLGPDRMARLDNSTLLCMDSSSFLLSFTSNILPWLTVLQWADHNQCSKARCKVKCHDHRCHLVTIHLQGCMPPNSQR